MIKTKISFIALCMVLFLTASVVASSPTLSIREKESYYEGYAEVGNEVIAVVIIENNPSADTDLSEIFYSWNWSEFEVKYYEEGILEADYERREVIVEDDIVTIKIPVKILAEGNDVVQFVYQLEGEYFPGMEFSPGVYIDTESSEGRKTIGKTGESKTETTTETKTGFFSRIVNWFKNIFS